MASIQFRCQAQEGIKLEGAPEDGMGMAGEKLELCG